MAGAAQTYFQDGWRLDVYEELQSTSDFCLRALELDPGLDRHAVMAKRQTRGRGSRGRFWSDAQGNLALSVIVKPPAGAGRLVLWPFLSSLALYHAVAALVGERTHLMIKWPNDLLLKGRKCGGILIEAGWSSAPQPDWCVIGFGVNIMALPPGLEGAASLGECGYRVDALALAQAILRGLDDVLAHYAAHGFEGVRSRWIAATCPAGTPMIVQGHGPGLVFVGLDDDGSLLVRRDAEVLKISTGDVLFPHYSLEA